jgi:hypothetical protein
MVASLAFSQSPHRIFIKCFNGKMKPAYALYCDDLSSPKQVCGFGYGTVGPAYYCLSSAICEPYLRPTCAAGNRLGVKAPISYICILGGAFVAHLEDRHRRVGPVVGDGFDYRIPWAAIGAVYKRIAVPEIFLVGHFGEAISAGCNVGGYLRKGSTAGGLRIACFDDELVFSVNYRYIDGTAGLYLRQGRLIVGLQTGQEFSYSFLVAL